MKVVFLLTERSGSVLLSRLLTGESTFGHGIGPDDLQAENVKGPDGKFYIATVEPHTVPFFSLGYLYPYSPTYILDQASGWKLEVFADNVIDRPTEAKIIELAKTRREQNFRGIAWTPDHIEYYSQRTNIKFINIIRDGRNQVASRKKRDLSRPKQLETTEQNCRDFLFRARSALQSNKQFNNYLLLKFEDLILDTRETLQRIVEFTGIQLDISEKIMKCMEKVIPNSSWGWGVENFKEKFNRSDILKRWGILTRDEREYLHSIAAQELVELGYLKDINDREWIDD